MYGSSFRMETCRPRALRSLPMLAAVMPLPSEEVTPPVTKTYFATGLLLRGFFSCYRKRPSRARRARRRPPASDGGMRSLGRREALQRGVQDRVAAREEID